MFLCVVSIIWYICLVVLVTFLYFLIAPQTCFSLVVIVVVKLFDLFLFFIINNALIRCIQLFFFVHQTFNFNYWLKFREQDVWAISETISCVENQWASRQISCFDIWSTQLTFVFPAHQVYTLHILSIFLVDSCYFTVSFILIFFIFILLFFVLFCICEAQKLSLLKEIVSLLLLGGIELTECHLGLIIWLANFDGFLLILLHQFLEVE